MPANRNEVSTALTVTAPLEGIGTTSSALWLRSPRSVPPLRVGILLDSAVLPRYCASVIEHIQACNFAHIELLIYRATAPNPHVPKGGRLSQIVRRLRRSDLRRHALYDLYLQLDERKKSPDHPRNSVDCAARLAGIDSITVEPIGKRFVHMFPPKAVAQVRARNLDVLIRFGFNILKGEILSASRYGIWSYHHGDNDSYRGGPPHFWELYERNPLSGVILQVLTEQLDAGLVLCKSLFTTEATLSVAQNNFGPYWGAADMMIRKLNELHRFGWERVRQKALPAARYQGKKALYRTPTNLEIVRFLAPAIVKKALRRPFQTSTVSHWKIGIRMNATPLFSRESDGSLNGFRWIESEKGHFWADPFLLEQDGRKWIFFEDYIYAQKRGLIACAQIDADGCLAMPMACLDERAHHYSYPHVFRDANELLMVPEARDSAAVDLYRCEEFPGKWAKCATLLRGRFVDPTIWRYEGLWWMMVTCADPDARSSSMYLFYADSPAGPWRMHPENPISADIRTNRGAGLMLQQEGRLIRPSQSGSPTYGYSFTLNEVTKLSPSEYAEHAIREFKPEALRLDATHTYNWISGVEVIDGAKMTPMTNV